MDLEQIIVLAFIACAVAPLIWALRRSRNTSQTANATPPGRVERS